MSFENFDYKTSHVNCLNTHAEYYSGESHIVDIQLYNNDLRCAKLQKVELKRTIG